MAKCNILSMSVIAALLGIGSLQGEEITTLLFEKLDNLKTKESKRLEIMHVIERAENGDLELKDIQLIQQILEKGSFQLDKEKSDTGTECWN